MSSPRAISCTDAANCTVIGDYPDNARYRMDAFIATEKHGGWTKAVPLPGLAALQSTAGNRYTDVDALACDPAGDLRRWASSPTRGGTRFPSC